MSLSVNNTVGLSISMKYGSDGKTVKTKICSSIFCNSRLESRRICAFLGLSRAGTQGARLTITWDNGGNSEVLLRVRSNRNAR